MNPIYKCESYWMSYVVYFFSVLDSGLNYFSIANLWDYVSSVYQIQLQHAEIFHGEVEEERGQR